MIKIIKGTYGHFDGRRVIPVTEADGPQSFSAEVEARLVKKGVAVYVDEEPKQNAGKTDEGQNAGEVDVSAEEEAPENSNGSELPAYDESMKLSELKEIAEAYGVDASKARSRAQVIAMIKADQNAEADADEEPPVVGAAMPE